MNDAPEEDIIDQALMDLLNHVVDSASAPDLSDEEKEDALDEAGDLVFDVIDDMVEDEEIPEIPDNRESDEIKQQWLDQHLPVLKARVEEILAEPEEDEDGDSDLEQ